MNAAKVFNAGIPLTINAGATLNTSTYLLTLGGNFTSNGTFTCGTGGITITGTATTQTLSGFTTSGNLSVTKTAGVATITGSVSAVNLSVSASGSTLILSGINSFSGTRTLTSGTLQLSNSAALGNSATALSLNGGILDLMTDGSLNTYNITVGGAASISSDRAISGAAVNYTFGALSIGNYQLSITAGTNITSGTAGITFGTTTLSASTPKFDVASGTNLTLGALTGNYAFTKQNSGQLTLNTASARTSGTVTLMAGTLSLGSTSALGTTGVALALNGGILDLNTDVSVNAYNVTVAGTPTISSDRATSGSAIIHTLGTLSIGNYQLNVTTGSNVTGGVAGLIFGTSTFSAATPVFDVASGANLTLGALTGNYAFTKQNAGQLTLNTASTRSGGTVTLTAGTLILGSVNALGTIAVPLVLNGGTLDLMTDATVNAYPVTVGGVATIISDRATAGAGITHTLGTLSIGNNQLNLNVGTKVTSGTAGLVLGATTLSASTSVFDIANGANMTLGAITGNFAFTKQDIGQLTLNTASTRSSGTVTLTAGTLSLGNTTALGTTGVLLALNGGILDLMTNSSMSAYNIQVGGDATILSDRLSAGTGISHVLGTLSLGAQTLTVNKGSYVTSGTAIVQFGDLTLTDNGALSPGTANIIMAGAAYGSFKLTKTGAGTLQKTNYGWALPGDFEVKAGYYDANALATTVTGLTTVSGGTYTAGSAAQTFSGGLTLSGGTYTGLSGTAGNTVSSNITFNSGTFSAPGSTGTFNVSGDWTNNGGVFTHNSGTVVFNGSSSQSIGGSVMSILNNLTIDNTSGVSLARSVTINGAFTLANGIVTTGTSAVILGNSATISGADSWDYINGNLTKGIAASTASMTFEIGDASYYTPVSLLFYGTTNGTGTITASTTNGNHPNINTSTINPSLNVNRYWTLTNSGVSGFSAYDAVFTFNSADIDAGADYTSFITGNYYSSTWSYPTTGITTSTSTQALGITAFGDFQVGESSGATTACLYGDNGSSPAVSNIIPCVDFPSNPQTISTTLAAHQYFTMNVISGLTYQVYTCNSSSPSSPLKMVVYKEGAPSDPYLAFSYVNTGNPCSSVTNNVYVSFTPNFSGQVRILINRKSDCSSVTPSGLTVKVNVSGGSNTKDNEANAGSDSWIGHIYDGINFDSYLGYYNQTESFEESFGSGGTWPNMLNDDLSCFNVYSDGQIRGAVKIVTFSVRYRMNSSRSGLYTVKLTSDDGARLYVDGNQVFSDWTLHSPTIYSNVLMSLSGTSSLAYEYFENTGQDVVAFENLVQIIANTLSANTAQSICLGNSGSAISGDVFGTLPSGITLSGTGYQWAYSTVSSAGPWTDITGATSATYTPSTVSSPFNAAGTYYFIRKAILSSTNNISPYPYVATNASNAAVITVYAVSVGGTVSGGTTICSGNTSNLLTLSGYTGTIVKWQSSVSPFTSWTDIANTSATYTSGVLTQTTQFRAVVQSGNCGTANSSATTVTVNPNLPVSITIAASANPICAGTSVTFTATPTNGGSAPSYQWKLNGTNAGTNSSTYTNSTLADGNTVSCVMTSNAGCVTGNPATSNTITMTVNANLPVSVTIAASANPVCSGTSVTFTATPVNGGTVPTYQWKLNGSNVGTNSSTYTNSSLANGNTVSCVLTSNATCATGNPATSNTVTMTVNPILPVSVTVSASANPVCSGVSVTFTATPVNGGLSPAYQWQLNGSNTGTNSSTYVTSTLVNGDAVSCVLTSNAACTTGNPATSNAVTITITATGTWLGTTSADWNVPGNWSCNTVPDINTNIQIPNVTNKPVISSGATGTAKNIVIASGSSLTVTGNTLQISGTITNSGTFTASAGTIEMKGSTGQVIGANVFTGSTVMNLTINNSSGVTLQGSLNVSGVVTVTSGNFASGGYLTLLSTAAQTALINGAGAGNVTGNVTMQRYIATGFGYKYFSSPFQAATVNEFADDIDLTASFPTFFKYDESAVSSGWISYISTSGTLVPMQGYAANMGTSLVAKTVAMKGVVNNGTLGPGALYNHNNPYTLGYNLAGNPYPSPIDWNAASGWTKTNIDNAIYYYNNGSTDQYTGTYSTYINGISSDGIANNIIPSMQGFFIHVSSGTYPVTAQFGMNNSVRVNNLSPVFHKAVQAETRPVLRLAAAFDNDGAINDPLVIYFDDVTSSAFDRDHDALKIINTDFGVPNIYAVSADGKKVSIKAVPAAADSLTVIPLGLKIFSDDWIRIKVTEIERIQSDLNVYLYDAETKIYRNLNYNPDVRFYVHTGNNENRFSIVFSKKELKYGSGSDVEFIVYCSEKKIFVYSYLAPGETGEITVYNMLGQPLGKLMVHENTLHELDFNLHDGVYIVEFSSQRGIKSKKVLITDQ